LTPSHRKPRGFAHIETWVFDLDNTLYPADCNLFAQIDRRMGEFIANSFGIPLEEAQILRETYYYEHGTTLAGLVRLHGVSPHAFLDYVHDIDLGAVAASPELAAAMDGLPGRKFVFTNGSRKHAEAVAARGIAARRVGFCIDTAHAWAAGIDLSDPDAIDAFLSDFDERIGLDRLVMFHLNDSKSELGSRLDRHEHLGAGRIGVSGLRHLLRHPALGHAVYYLETPGMDDGYDAINLARAHDIAAGRPLADLPPGAMTLRGSRARTGPAPDEPQEPPKASE